MPYDRQAVCRGKALGEEQLVNFPLRQRRNDQKQEPKSSADVTRFRWEEKAGHCRAREDNDCGDTPAMPARARLTCNPREQNHGRDDRDKKKDVVEVDQNCARLGGSPSFRRLVKLRADAFLSSPTGRYCPY